MVTEIFKEPQTIWGSVIKNKYGEQDNWVTKEVNTPDGVSQWRPIRVLWPFMKSHSMIRVHYGNKNIFGKVSVKAIGVCRSSFTELYPGQWQRCGPLRLGAVIYNDE